MRIVDCVKLVVAIALVPLFGTAQVEKLGTVSESERMLPLSYDVDVIVVGGTLRGVAAAEAAAKAGCKVFLCEDRPYLGVDVCGTYRLWLEEGEQPETQLGEAIYGDALVQTNLESEDCLPFTYSASLKSHSRHPDTGNMLTDGKFSKVGPDSVQYNGDVTLIADLGKPTKLAGVRLMAFNRADDFVIERVTVSVSSDKQSWQSLGNAPNILPRLQTRDVPVLHTLDQTAAARYVRVEVAKGERVERLLVAELAILAPGRHSDAKAVGNRRVVTPMAVKNALDNALLNSKVDFLYGSYVTEVLRDPEGKLAGIVVANRSGRQAIRGKVIIDATDRGVAARIAGAPFTDYPSGPQTFCRIVLGGKPGRKAKDTGLRYQVGGKKSSSYPVYEYEFEIPMRDGSWSSFVEADKIARDQSWHHDQAGYAEMLFQVPPDSVKSEGAYAGSWPGANEFPLAALTPSGVDHLFVLGGCADVTRETAGKLLRPLNGIRLGQRVGAAAAQEAKAREFATASQLVVGGSSGPASIQAEVGEMLGGLRWHPSEGAVRSPASVLPVLGRYDTVVVGGGTGGAPAGIAAARAGARTLVIEYLHGLGGVGTLGRVAVYYHGNRAGFNIEVEKGVSAMAGDITSRSGYKSDEFHQDFDIETKMEWLRRELAKAGADVWFMSLGVGSVVQGDRFKGVVIATPQGRGVVLANTVIDSTGNAVIPHAAGCKTQMIGGEHIAVQGTGLPPWTPGEDKQNSDWTFVLDDDVMDMWRTLVVAKKKKFSGAYDHGQLIDTRARRRIIGDIVISPMDIINQRVFPDVITVSKSRFDNHGFPSHDLFFILRQNRSDSLYSNVPYRALLPKGYDGILVTGLGMSAHGDAMPVMRMQRDIENHSYAAGYASALAAREGTTVRKIDVEQLQRHLADIGTIPEELIRAKDSYPLSEAQIKVAVASVGRDYTGIAQILTQTETALPLLREAHNRAEDETVRLRYAHVLGMLRDGTGAQALIQAVAKAQWDKGYNFSGFGNHQQTTSPLDDLIIALGRTGEASAMDVLIEKAQQLTPASDFSHFRALAIAFESIRDPRAAKPLARLLRMPAVGGHAFREIQDVIQRTPGGLGDNSTRNVSLRELILARALYRCGDHEELGKKTLEAYRTDFRGHYATHARAVLAETK